MIPVSTFPSGFLFGKKEQAKHLSVLAILKEESGFKEIIHIFRYYKTFHSFCSWQQHGKKGRERNKARGRIKKNVKVQREVKKIDTIFIYVSMSFLSGFFFLFFYFAFLCKNPHIMQKTKCGGKVWKAETETKSFNKYFHCKFMLKIN